MHSEHVDLATRLARNGMLNEKTRPLWDRNVYGTSWTMWESDFDKYYDKYDTEESVSYEIKRTWWRQGAEPFEAAKHEVNGVEPWL